MTTASIEAPRTKKGNRSKGGGAKPKDPWGSPAVYFIALVIIGLSLAPVAYIVLGGFRDNSQLTVDPAGFPNPWRWSTYGNILQSSTFWREFLNSVVAAGAPRCWWCRWA